MKTLGFTALLLLAACSQQQPEVVYRNSGDTSRYELSTSGRQTFLLEKRSGRVWLWEAEEFTEVTPTALYTNPALTSAPTPTNAFAELIPPPAK
jgi:hypothetical protein